MCSFMRNWFHFTFRPELTCTGTFVLVPKKGSNVCDKRKPSEVRSGDPESYGKTDSRTHRWWYLRRTRWSTYFGCEYGCVGFLSPVIEKRGGCRSFLRLSLTIPQTPIRDPSKRPSPCEVESERSINLLSVPFPLSFKSFLLSRNFFVTTDSPKTPFSLVGYTEGIRKNYAPESVRRKISFTGIWTTTDSVYCPIIIDNKLRFQSTVDVTV